MNHIKRIWCLLFGHDHVNTRTWREGEGTVFRHYCYRCRKTLSPEVRKP